MIGQRRLAAIARILEHQGSGQFCQGEFVLQTQRTLYGSETVHLTNEEMLEVVAFLIPQRRRNAEACRCERPASRLRAEPSGSIHDFEPPKGPSHALRESRRES